MYADHPSLVTEFDLRKLDREADQLSRIDATVGSVVKAAVAAFRWDVEKVVYWSDNAIRLHKSFFTLSNAAVSRRMVGDIRASADLAVESFEYTNRGAEAALIVLDALLLNARFAEVLQFAADALDKSTISSELFEHVEYARQAVNDLNQLGIDQEEVCERIEIGSSLCAEHQVRIKSLSTYLVPDYEDGDRFVASLNFSGDIHKEIALDGALVEKFLDDPTWDPMKLSVEFHYMTEDELQSI